MLFSGIYSKGFSGGVNFFDTDGAEGFYALTYCLVALTYCWALTCFFGYTETYPSTSCFIILPSGPEPFISLIFIPFSAARVLAAGLANTLSPGWWDTGVGAFGVEGCSLFSDVSIFI